MKYFTLSLDPYTTGFQEHVTINLRKPIEQQLNRRRLFHRAGGGSDNRESIKKIITHNASLRIDFGWAMESENDLTTIMNDCIKDIIPKYNINVGHMVSDMRCSWMGFEPHNMYDKEVYKDLSLYSLIIYNNEIIDFQTEIVKGISNHPIYRKHAIIRDSWYRFENFKIVRKDRDLLAERYHYYMDAVRTVSLVTSVPRDIIEESIGMHFLHHPDLFFELLEFSILKGDIYD